MAIVKVQMPIASSEEHPKALVTTQNKELIDFLEITPSLRRLMRNQLKAYFYADVTVDGEVKLCGRAPWQSW